MTRSSERRTPHGDIAAHLAEVYGAEVSKQTITAITGRVMEQGSGHSRMLRHCWPGDAAGNEAAALACQA